MRESQQPHPTPGPSFLFFLAVRTLVLSGLLSYWQVCRADLEMLPLEKYTTVFILHEEYKNIQEADGRILTTLFLLRDIHQKRAKTMKVDREHLTIISEVCTAPKR